MSNFSIGEMSKLNNISIQTLRYYDKIGLLKPKVISEKS
ncbi:MerR family DNA-binding transcriptional regulator [Clostridium beijerinckii]